MALTLAGTPAINGLALPSDTFVSGMVLVNKTDFTATSSLVLNNIFTATYDNYYVVFSKAAGTTTSTVYMYLRASGTNSSTGLYTGILNLRSNNTTGMNGGDNLAYFHGLQLVPDDRGSAAYHINSPYLAARTNFHGTGAGGDATAPMSYILGGFAANTNQYDGLNFVPSGGTMSGTVRVYGLRNA